MINQNTWCANEFSGINLGDQRLNSRFLEMSGNLLKHPSAPIMEASQSWREAKAAYRLFENSKLSAAHILGPHKEQTLRRLEQQKSLVYFAIQDTTTLNYAHHFKKKDMGKIRKLAGYKNPLTGCYAHNTLLVTEQALPLGLINQKIYKHALEENKSDNKKRPITEKESYRWIESLRETKNITIEVPAKNGLPKRRADLEVRFAEIEFTPPSVYLVHS